MKLLLRGVFPHCWLPLLPNIHMFGTGAPFNTGLLVAVSLWAIISENNLAVVCLCAYVCFAGHLQH
jgi:hypothetical protein